jgi:hypothetical protein
MADCLWYRHQYERGRSPLGVHALMGDALHWSLGGGNDTGPRLGWRLD